MSLLLAVLLGLQGIQPTAPRCGAEGTLFWACWRQDGECERARGPHGVRDHIEACRQASSCFRAYVRECKPPKASPWRDSR